MREPDKRGPDYMSRGPVGSREGQKMNMKQDDIHANYDFHVYYDDHADCDYYDCNC